MKKYYAERHGLLTKQLQIDFDELLQYFRQVHKYFCDKEYFEVATRGVWRQIPYRQYENLMCEIRCKYSVQTSYVHMETLENSAESCEEFDEAWN